MPTRTHILWMENTDSTNDELRRRMSGLDNLSIIASESQSSGRGQGEHSWHSLPGENLTFSILMRFDGLAARDAILITCAVTLGIRDHLLSRGVETGIKWPNDIWAGGRKICGILIENIVSSGYIRESIVGIGLNLNATEWPDDLPNPVSLKQLTGKTYNLRTELAALSKEICRRYGQTATSDGRILLQEEFGKNMFRLDGERK